MNLISFIDYIGFPVATLDKSKAKENFTRVFHLLLGKATDALRAVLQAIHPPSTLATVLHANKADLQSLRHGGMITKKQWVLLFPASGAAPDSNNFDITLLITLLRNICRLPQPATGWAEMPPAGDTSISADIVRIKHVKDEVAHKANDQLDDTTFESLWQEISQPLARLGVLQKDIDEIKKGPLCPEEGILSDVKKKRRVSSSGGSRVSQNKI